MHKQFWNFKNLESVPLIIFRYLSIFEKLTIFLNKKKNNAKLLRWTLFVLLWAVGIFSIFIFWKNMSELHKTKFLLSCARFVLNFSIHFFHRSSSKKIIFPRKKIYIEMQISKCSRLSWAPNITNFHLYSLLDKNLQNCISFVNCRNQCCNSKISNLGYLRKFFLRIIRIWRTNIKKKNYHKTSST